MTPAAQAVRSVLGPLTSETKCREVVKAVLTALRPELEILMEAARYEIENGGQTFADHAQAASDAIQAALSEEG